jgi:hypothetical protein
VKNKIPLEFELLRDPFEHAGLQFSIVAAA